MIMRVCKECCRSLPITEFWARNKAKGIYTIRCKECEKAIRMQRMPTAANRPRIKYPERTCLGCEKYPCFRGQDGTFAGHDTFPARGTLFAAYGCVAYHEKGGDR